MKKIFPFKMIPFPLFLIIFILVCTSCKTIQKEPIINTHNINFNTPYIVGVKGSTVNTLSIDIVCWNDQKMSLIQNYNELLDIRDVFITKNDIYITGCITKGYNTVATYWKNGERNDLSNENSDTSAIFIDNNDIYVVGDNEGIPCYWKNGICTKIQDAFWLTSIALLNGDVYIAGCDSNGSNNRACVWKNENKIVLSDFEYFSNAFDMIVENNNIYIVGHEQKHDEFTGTLLFSRSILWKNFEKIILTETENDVYAIDITSSNGNIYIAEHEVIYPKKNNDYMQDISYYWKNNNRILLSHEFDISKIAINNEDVYCLGKKYIQPVYHFLIKNGKIIQSWVLEDTKNGYPKTMTIGN